MFLAAILFCVGILAFVGLGVWAHFTMKCPDCEGRMLDVGDHIHVASTSTIWKCVSCKKEWI